MAGDIRPPIGAVVMLARIPPGVAGLIPVPNMRERAPSLKLLECFVTAFVYM